MAEQGSVPWIPDGTLPTSLILASTPNLTLDDGSRSVPQSAPYRVLETDGTVLLIEVMLAGGERVTGYTTRERTSGRRGKRRWFR